MSTVIRKVSNPFVVEEEVIVEHRFEIMIYKAFVSIEAEHLSIRREVEVTGYGLSILKHTQYENAVFTQEYDCGILSAKHNEVSYLVSLLVRMKNPNIHLMKSVIRREILSWPESFQKAALRKLKEELGLLRFNPFKIYH